MTFQNGTLGWRWDVGLGQVWSLKRFFEICSLIFSPNLHTWQKEHPSSLDHKTSSSKPNFYSWCDDCPPKDSDRWCKELDSNYFQPFTLKSVICMSELDEHHPCPIVFLLDSPFWWQLGTQQLNFVTDTCLDVHMFLFSTDATDMSQWSSLKVGSNWSIEWGFPQVPLSL